MQCSLTEALFCTTILTRGCCRHPFLRRLGVCACVHAGTLTRMGGNMFIDIRTYVCTELQSVQVATTTCRDHIQHARGVCTSCPQSNLKPGLPCTVIRLMTSTFVFMSLWQKRVRRVANSNTHSCTNIYVDEARTITRTVIRMEGRFGVARFLS
jgi:hypothetical protein